MRKWKLSCAGINNSSQKIFHHRLLRKVSSVFCFEITQEFFAWKADLWHQVNLPKRKSDIWKKLKLLILIRIFILVPYFCRHKCSVHKSELSPFPFLQHVFWKSEVQFHFLPHYHCDGIINNIECLWETVVIHKSLRNASENMQQS